MRRSMLWVMVLCVVIIGVAGGLAQEIEESRSYFAVPPEPVVQDADFAAQEKRLMAHVREHPHDATPALDLAEFYAIHRYYDQAESLLGGVIHNDPEAARAHFLLGKIVGRPGQESERSIAELKEAVRLEPDSILYRQELVSVYYRFQRYPPALVQLEAILAREPGNEDAQYRRAVILHILGRTDEAERGVDRIPHHEHARVLMAIIVQQRGEDAKPLYEAILKDYPNNLRARYEYAKLQMREGNTSETQAIFEKIIDDDPFYQHAIFQLVKIYAQKGEREKSMLAKQSLDTINRMGRDKRGFYRSYLRHHPDTAETHYQMALIYLEIGRGNLAAGELRETWQRDPSNHEAPFLLVQVEMASHRFAEAIPWLERCLETRDDKASLHALLAQCYLELHDAENARRHLDAAFSLDPNNPLARQLIKRSRQTTP